MREQTKPLAELIEDLPPEIEKEVEDFIEFLLEKRVRKPKATFRLDWRGALRNLRDEFTSVELQHDK